MHVPVHCKHNGNINRAKRRYGLEISPPRDIRVRPPIEELYEHAGQRDPNGQRQRVHVDYAGENELVKSRRVQSCCMAYPVCSPLPGRPCKLCPWRI